MVHLLKYDEVKYSVCEYYPSNNVGGEKRIALHFKNEKNKIFDGQGKTFCFDDDVFPIVLDSCENITLRNFSIDFKNPQHFEGEIVFSNSTGFLFKPWGCGDLAVNDGMLEVSLGGQKRIFEGFFGQVFDCKTKAPYKKQDSISLRFLKPGEKVKKTFEERVYARLEQMENGIFFRLEKDDAKKLYVPQGGRLVFGLRSRTIDGVFIQNSKNIKIENVNIYRSPAMGIIAQLTEDITLQNVNVGVKQNRTDLLSTIADATHFVNCYGKICIKNCSFYNMMDDATNIHGIYGKVVEVSGNTAKLQLMHAQQKGVLFIRSGDMVKFISADNYKQKTTLKVIDSDISDDKEYVLLSFAEELDLVSVGDVAENVSAMPEVYISKCKTGNNRPRGFLLTSGRKMEVENCLFENSRSAIHVSADANKWYESGSVNELHIHDNHFKNCNYATGEAAITIQAPINTGKDFFHSNIYIFNNLVEVDEAGFVYLDGVKDVYVQNNTIESSSRVNTNSFIPLIKVNACKNVVIDKNIQGDACKDRKFVEISNV